MSPVVKFMFECVWPESNASQPEVLAFKLVLPSRPGFLAETDFLSRRLAGCGLINSLKTFGVAGQELCYIPISDDVDKEVENVLKLMDSAICLMSLNHYPSRSPLYALESLEMALINRLSFPWILKQPSKRYRIALVEARHLSGGRDVPPKLFLSAVNLGISLVVLDREGHEVQNCPNLYEKFLPIDMTLDDALPSRIATALQDPDYRVDGITSFTDRYLVATARAAKILGLPIIMQSESLSLSTDKYIMRQLSTESEYTSLLVSGPEELEQTMGAFTDPVGFPLVVKPSHGKNSEGVSKVANSRELFHSVARLARTESAVGSKIVIEPYISGPEIDANYVLLDGEILFSEIGDDFPSAGDSDTADFTADFHESAMLYPSGLPQKECDLMRKSLYDLLLKAGFRTGIFHVEARIRNSEMEYQLSSDGLMDLVKIVAPGKIYQKTRPFLLEINARAPGQMLTWGAEFTYGIDYFSLQLLAAVMDRERLTALSRPFLHGAQSWTSVVFVPTKGLGIFDGDDVFQDLHRRHPELMAQVSHHRCMFRHGDSILPLSDGSWPWVAWFVAFSRINRYHVVKLGHMIKDRLHYNVIER
ncbi:hypothetical protein DPV78_005373 [Talaromyces pinophilus]|nr:hypothetical protein DPV78_005373 [Talaromyces pinophilus]